MRSPPKGTTSRIEGKWFKRPINAFVVPFILQLFNLQTAGRRLGQGDYAALVSSHDQGISGECFIFHLHVSFPLSLSVCHVRSRAVDPTLIMIRQSDETISPNSITSSVVVLLFSTHRISIYTISNVENTVGSYLIHLDGLRLSFCIVLHSENSEMRIKWELFGRNEKGKWGMNLTFHSLKFRSRFMIDVGTSGCTPVQVKIPLISKHAITHVFYHK